MQPAPRPRRQLLPVDLAFAVAVLGASALILAVSARGWFTFDDWMLLGSRLDVYDDDGAAAFLFRSHNDHLMTGVILWQHATVKLFGLGSYVPSAVMIAGAHAAIAVVVRLFLLRVGVDRPAASVWAVALMVWGPAFGCMVWGLEASFSVVTALVLAHLLLVDQDGAVGRRDVAGAAVALVALASHSVAVPGLLAVGCLLAYRRRWRALLVAWSPFVPYTMWWVTYRPRGAVYAWLPGEVDYSGVRTPLDVQLDFFRVLWSTPLSAALPAWPSLVIIVAAAGAVLGWLVPRGDRRWELLVALMLFGLLFAGATARSRSLLGPQFAASFRYVYVVTVVVLPFLALAAQGLGEHVARRRSRRWSAAVSVGLAVTVGALSATDVRGSADFVRGFMDASRREVNRVAHLDDLERLPSELRVDAATFDLNIDHVRRLVRMGLLPVDPRPSDDELRATRDRLLRQ